MNARDRESQGLIDFFLIRWRLKMTAVFIAFWDTNFTNIYLRGEISVEVKTISKGINVTFYLYRSNSIQVEHK